MQRIAVDAKQAGELLSVSERMIHVLLSEGRLRGRKIGRRTVIPLKAIEDFLKRAPLRAGERRT